MSSKQTGSLTQTESLIRTDGVTKRFGSVTALDDLTRPLLAVA